MAESYLDKVANELADMALADQAASGDIGIVDKIGEVLGASSQILEEAYNTAVRVRRAEARAREMLAARQAQGFKLSPKPALPSEETLEDAEVVETPADEAVVDVTAETAAQEENSAAKAFEEVKARARAEAEAKAQAEAAAKAKAAAEATAAEEAKKAAEAKAAKAKPAAKHVPAPWDLDGV